MNRYEKYKDSGIAWIGEIPEHWEVCRLKHLCKIKDGTHDTPRYITQSDLSYPLITSKCIINGVVDYSLANHICENDYIEINKRSNVEQYDVIMPMIGTVGNPAIIETKNKFSIKNVALFKMQNNLHRAKYLKYLLNSSLVLEQFSKGNRGGVQQFVSQDFLKNIIIISNKDYSSIVKYLDWKCGEVDKIVAVREEQIKLLGELRTSVISRAVTKGLNPDAPLKDSGIPWIGSIPAHWGNGRLKNFCSLKGRIGWKGLRSDEFKSKSYAYLVTGQDFTSSSILWSKCYQIDQVRYEEDPYIQLNNGDLLITKDGTIGKVAKVDKMDKPACLNSGIFVMKQKSNNSFKQDYLYWLLFSNALRDFNNFTSTGTTILHLYQNVFEIMPFIVPSLSEQQAIADYLDKKTAEIDSAVAKYKEQIAKLKEYRQALITEVVTGKIDVRDVVIPT